MIQIESFQEFRAGLALLRGGEAHKALPHLRSATRAGNQPIHFIFRIWASPSRQQSKNGRRRRSAATSAMRLNRRQAQLYLNLAEVYVAADRRQDAADILGSGDCTTLPYTMCD